MKHTKLFAVTSSVAILSALVIVGYAPQNAIQAVGAARTAQPTLRLATSADYKPYEYHDTSTGQDRIVGFDIDVATEIAKELHFKFTVSDMTFDGLVGALQAHRADFVIAGMTPTAARKKSVDFSNIYYQAKNAIVTKKGSKLTTRAALVGKKVGVQLGSTQEQDAKTIKGATVVSLDTIPEIIQDLKTNRIDAAIIESTVAKGNLATNPDLQMNMTTSGDAGSAIAFPKGSPWVNKFNQVLAHMQRDGQMKQLIVKWFGK